MLAIPYFKQDTTYSCGAVSVQMLLRYFGITISERTLMELLGTDTEYGTHHQPIIECLTNHGLYCYVDTDSTLEEVSRHLDSSLPVLVHYIEPSADEHHYSVVVGSTSTHVLLHDPWNGPAFTLPHTDFLERWHDNMHAYPR